MFKSVKLIALSFTLTSLIIPNITFALTQSPLRVESGLSRGVSGTKVYSLQDALSTIPRPEGGTYLNVGSGDTGYGYFGNATARAVNAVRLDNGLPSGTNVGPLTSELINNLYSATIGTQINSSTVGSVSVNKDTSTPCSKGELFNRYTGDSCFTKSLSLSKVAPIQPKVSTPVKSSASQVTTIDSCREITQPGTYTLESDVTHLKSHFGACVYVHDVSDIIFDCKGHTINPLNEISMNPSASIDDYRVLYLKNVSNFKIGNCKIDVTVKNIFTSSTLEITNSATGEFYNNTIGETTMIVSSSTNVFISNNFFAKELDVDSSNNVSVTKNNFKYNNKISITAPIVLKNGSNNLVSWNNIDGNSDGVFNGLNSVGADEGIVIIDESNDVIKNNIIQNVFDCGIENTGYMFDSTITDNLVKNAGYCVIGGWYKSSVKGNLIQRNIGENTGSLFKFFRSPWAGPVAYQSHVYFKDNTFEDNKLINLTKIDQGSQVLVTSISNDYVLPTNIVVGNNIFKNNDFIATSNPLNFYPVDMFIDGGGNKCSYTMSLQTDSLGMPVVKKNSALNCSNSNIPPILSPVATSAKIYIDGFSNLRDINVYVGQPHTKTWTGTDGSSYSSSYVITQAPGGVTCSLTGSNGAWIANTASGRNDSVVQAIYAGCKVAITYKALDVQGQTVASDTLNLTVLPSLSVVSPPVGSQPVTLPVVVSEATPVVVKPIATPTAPSAKIYIDGFSNLRDINVYVGQPHTKTWTGTDGSSYSSSYVITQAPGGVTCSLTGSNGAWIANTASGRNDSVVQAIYAGCKVAITYKALDVQGQTVASDTLNLTVLPALTSSVTYKAAVLGAYTSSPSCVDLPYNMHRGAESSYVAKLQKFLFQKGFFTEQSSGFYGDKTIEAVNDYQASKGLPVTGMVYELTRQIIKTETCR